MNSDEKPAELRIFELTDSHVEEIHLITDLKGKEAPRVQMTARWRFDRETIFAVGPRRLVLADPSVDIDDIRIGNRSQFVQRGRIPGDLFSSAVIGAYVRFDTIQTAWDFELVVSYPSEMDSPKIRPFAAQLHGLVAPCLAHR